MPVYNITDKSVSKKRKKKRREWEMQTENEKG